jgi:hypothetical protein
MVKEFRDPMTGYVAQAAASATAANASKAAAANSATAASASKVDAANSAATASGKASQAAQSAASASASAASAKYYADSLKNDLDHINGTLDAHEQRLADLDWTPWGIAITAAREARIAMQQALHDYRTDLELERVAQVTAANAQELADLSWAPWAAAITAVRSAASAMRQAMEIFRLYRLVEALSAGGGSGGSLFFVPE